MTTAQDDNAPATQKGLATLEGVMKQGLATLEGVMKQGLATLEGVTKQNFASKQDLQDVVGLLMGTLESMEQRMATKEYVKEAIYQSEGRLITVMEKWHLDLVGIHKDKISQHEDRITRLEAQNGLLAV